MSTRSKQWSRWLGRILGILQVLFVSLFALDAFGTGAGFWQTLLGFLIHMIPSFCLIIAVIIAWRSPRLGAILFGLVAIGFVVLLGLDEPFLSYVSFVLPPLITAALVLLGQEVAPEPGRDAKAMP